MTTKYYVDENGVYIGASDSPTPPVGSTEVFSPPSDSRQIWDGASWYMPPQSSALSEYRDFKLNTVLTIEIPDGPEYGNGGEVIYLRNDERTTDAILEKIQDFIDDESITSIAFQTINFSQININEEEEPVWYDLNPADYQFIRRFMSAYTQKIFDAKRVIESNHSSSPYTDESWKSDFDALLA